MLPIRQPKATWRNRNQSKSINKQAYLLEIGFQLKIQVVYCSQVDARKSDIFTYRCIKIGLNFRLLFKHFNFSLGSDGTDNDRTSATIDKSAPEDQVYLCKL